MEKKSSKYLINYLFSKMYCFITQYNNHFFRISVNEKACVEPKTIKKNYLLCAQITCEWSSKQEMAYEVPEKLLHVQIITKIETNISEMNVGNLSLFCW